MTYGDAIPFSTIERDAWQRGDTLTAQLAAEAEDRAEEVVQVETRRDELETELAQAKADGREAVQELKSDISRLTDTLYDLIHDAKRVSQREEMLALVVALGEFGNQ